MLLQLASRRLENTICDWLFLLLDFACLSQYRTFCFLSSALLLIMQLQSPLFPFGHFLVFSVPQAFSGSTGSCVESSIIAKELGLGLFRAWG